MVGPLPYRGYWGRKRLAAATPRFRVVRWWPSAGLSEVERLYFDAIRSCRRVLDVGAGDLAVMSKLRAAGLTSGYDTLDVGDEHPYSFRDFSEVRGPYDGILCLDVIEHLALGEGLALINGMYSVLEPGGVLVIQTPNARCVRNPMSWDMTHLHCYNLADLWAYLTHLGMAVVGYRVVFRAERPSLAERLRALVSRVVTAGVLGADYADNILVIARRATATAGSGPAA